MAVEGSVGQNGQNDVIDVKVIQSALNLVNPTRLTGAPELAIDGLIGPMTIGVIEQFQEDIVEMANPDGRIDPDGPSIARLQTSIPKGLTPTALRGIMVHSPPEVSDTYQPALSSLMEEYEVNTPLRIAHFLAQIGHESLSLRHTEEIASGEAYEGRSDLGNTEPRDGVRFKGRGLIQLTGRSNYEEYGNSVGTDFLQEGNEKKIATDPRYAVDVSLWFWQSRNLSRHADDDDLRAVTRRINGGLNGIEDRQRYLNRARFFFL